MAGNASRKNGELGGRLPGSKDNKTLECEVAAQQYQQLVLQRLLPIFENQYSLAKGTAYLFRIEEKANGAKEHVLAGLLRSAPEAAICQERALYPRHIPRQRYVA